MVYARWGHSIFTRSYAFVAVEKAITFIQPQMRKKLAKVSEKEDFYSAFRHLQQQLEGENC